MSIDNNVNLYLVMGRAGLAQPEPDRACAFGDEARHDTKMEWVVTCRPAEPKVKPWHGPIAFKRVMPGLWPIRPYHVRPARSPDIPNMFFPINLVILIKTI
jgi:hypothetical protein